MQTFPVVVEAFHNHHGQLKCYAVQSEVFVHKKRSMPVTMLNAEDPSGQTILMDGQIVSCAVPFVYRFHSLDSMPVSAVQAETAPDIDNGTLSQCAGCIARNTGLTLFGFDLIQQMPERGSRWLLIDVNAFPSFKGVSEAPACIRRAIKRLVASK